MSIVCCGLHRHTRVCVDACVVKTKGFPVYLSESNPLKEHLDWDAIIDQIPMSKAAQLVGNGMNIHLAGSALLISILSINWLELISEQGDVGAGSA